MEQELAKFAEAIQENKHLYTEEEFIELSSQWLVEYEKYLVDLVKEAKGG